MSKYLIFILSIIKLIQSIDISDIFLSYNLPLNKTYSGTDPSQYLTFKSIDTFMIGGYDTGILSITFHVNYKLNLTDGITEDFFLGSVRSFLTIGNV
jgi:hypothetical protein